MTAPPPPPDHPAREPRLHAMPVLSMLLGALLIAGVLNYTVLTWQHRIALETERGSSVAALAETRVDEAVGGITTALNLMANRAAWQGDGALGLTRAVRSGGRIGSVSLLDAEGRIEHSTVERNIGLRLAPDEYGGGWATARFGFGSLFRGRDLSDRRPATPGAADFTTVSVPATDGNGFAVATISLRALQVSLTGFLNGADSLAIALYWRDGNLLHSVGRNSVPPALPPDTLRRIMETDVATAPAPALRFADTTLLSCRSSRADPFIVCTHLVAGSILHEWDGWRGVALAALVLAVIITVAGAIRVSAEQRRRAREREILRLDIERAFLGGGEQFVVGDAAPEEERQPCRQFVAVEHRCGVRRSRLGEVDAGALELPEHPERVAPVAVGAARVVVAVSSAARPQVHPLGRRHPPRPQAHQHPRRPARRLPSQRRPAGVRLRFARGVRSRVPASDVFPDTRRSAPSGTPNCRAG